MAFKTYELHAIDIQRDDDEGIREELLEQMSSVGFLLLKNIPEYDEVRYLEACKAFHALPQVHSFIRLANIYIIVILQLVQLVSHNNHQFQVYYRECTLIIAGYDSYST